MQLSPSLAEFMDKLDQGPRGAEDALIAVEKCAAAASPVLDLQQMSLTDADLQRVLPSLSSVAAHVTTLNLFMNELTVLPAALSALRHLRELHAGCNPLAAVAPGLLRALPQLVELDVGFSEMLPALPDEFDALRNLRVLHAGNGRLAALPGSLCRGCPLLEELHAYGNSLAAVPDAIGALRSLRVLNLGRNQIRSLPDSIGECAHLHTLHLYENCLSRLPASLANIEALATLNVAANADLPVPPREVRCSPGVRATAQFYASLTTN